MNNSEEKNNAAEFNDIMNECDSIYRGISAYFGMSEAVFWLLYFIRTENRRLTQTEICDLLYQPKQTVNSALKKLEGEGLIVLAAGKDRRKKEIVLTKEGERLVLKTVDRLIFAENSAMESLGKEEIARLFAIHREYNAALKERIEKLKNQKG